MEAHGRTLWILHAILMGVWETEFVSIRWVFSNTGSPNFHIQNKGKSQHSVPNPSWRPEYADGQRSSVGHGHVHHESWIRPSEQRASDVTSIPREKSGRICSENEASSWCMEIMECINQNRILIEVIEVNCRIWCIKPCFWTLPDLNFKL